MGHSSKSPSSASLWMNCAKGAAASASEPDLTDPSHRSLGTAMHWFREQALRRGCDMFDLVGTTTYVEGEEFELDDETAFKMQDGIDRVRGFDGEIYVEQRVDISPWVGEGQFGTMDTGVIRPDLIVVDDFKNGFDPVDAECNEQLMLYALGFWHTIARHKTKATKFLLMIDQPNAIGGGVKEWEVTLDELLSFGELAKIASEKADDPDAPGSPGVKTCRWCRAKAKCGDIAAYLLNIFGISMSDFDDDLIGCGPELKAADDLTPEQRVAIINHGPMFKRWMEAVYAKTLDDALKGEATPGMKAVYGKPGNRKWGDEESAKEFALEFLPPEKVLTTKLKSPAQLEKAVGAKAFQAFESEISRSEPKPILVAFNDKREAIPPDNVADMFDDI